MTENDMLSARFLGSLLGVALGDAIGELAFRYPDEAPLRQAIASSNTLTYTDDTAMAIALAESLIAQSRVDTQHLGDTFRAHYEREPWRGYASGPPTIFAQVARHGGDYTAIAQTLFNGQGSYGNGAAMRVAPAGLYFHADADLYAQVRHTAVVTHTHPIGIDGAAVLAKAIALALTLDPSEALPRAAFIAELRGFARTAAMQEQLAQLETQLAQEATASSAGRRLGSGVAAHQSVPFAIYAFLRQPDSFEDCLFCAALHSGDRDTVAAMACAIAGAYLGSAALPPAWLEKLENREHIEALARGLYARSRQ